MQVHTQEQTCIATHDLGDTVVMTLNVCGQARAEKDDMSRRVEEAEGKSQDLGLQLSTLSRDLQEALSSCRGTQEKGQ